MTKRTLISFDWAIKRLLRQKANFVILEGFLSELLNDNIRIKNLLESESNQEIDTDKSNRVDLLCESEKEELIIIELQYYSEVDYFHRMLFGTSRVISEYISKGEPYAKVRKVYSVNILYFSLGQGNDYVYHGRLEFRGIHLQDELSLSEYQQKQFEKQTPGGIFPEYFIINVNNFNDLAKDSLDEWIYYLKHTELPVRYQARGLAQVAEKLKYEKMGTAAKKAYDKHLENVYVSRSMIETAKLEGRQEGLHISQSMLETAKLEGHEEGIEKGIERGIEQGMEKAIITTILNAHKAGLPIDMIATIAAVPEQKVENILRKNSKI